MSVISRSSRCTSSRTIAEQLLAQRRVLDRGQPFDRGAQRGERVLESRASTSAANALGRVDPLAQRLAHVGQRAREQADLVARARAGAAPPPRARAPAAPAPPRAPAAAAAGRSCAPGTATAGSTRSATTSQHDAQPEALVAHRLGDVARVARGQHRAAARPTGAAAVMTGVRSGARHTLVARRRSRRARVRTSGQAQRRVAPARDRAARGRRRRPCRSPRRASARRPGPSGPCRRIAQREVAQPRARSCRRSAVPSRVVQPHARAGIARPSCASAARRARSRRRPRRAPRAISRASRARLRDAAVDHAAAVADRGRRSRPPSSSQREDVDRQDARA